MPIDVLLIVLFGAFLHASWNGLVKAGDDKFLDTMVVACGAAAVSALALPFLPLPQAASWPYIAASIAIHVVYFGLVAAAYRAGDMSLTYPLMRGTAPLIVALVSGPLLGEYLSGVAWAGIVMICAGVFGLTMLQRLPAAPAGAAVLLALANAVVIALYTLVDGTGARLSGHAVAYTLWMLALTGLPLAVWAVWRRGADVVLHLRRRWQIGLTGGICTLTAYALVLWAMTQAPLAVVAALRETSILFATILSALLLKERFGWTRHAAALLLVLGAAALRLA